MSGITQGNKRSSMGIPLLDTPLNSRFSLGGDLQRRGNEAVQ